MRGTRIGVGVDRDRLDVELAAGADDAAGDLAAIRDQQSLNHGQSPFVNS